MPDETTQNAAPSRRWIAYVMTGVWSTGPSVFSDESIVADLVANDFYERVEEVEVVKVLKEADRG